MGLLIKGMNIPEYTNALGNDHSEVYLCMLSVNRDGSAFLYSNYSGDNHFHTVVETPTTHGRLIDADKLLKAMGKAVDEDGHWTNFFAVVEDAPTIIEEEC